MEFIITIALTLGGGGYTLDVNPTLVAPTRIAFQLNQAGLSWVPHLVLYTPGYRGAVRHELVHSRHWTALGPAFPLAYAMTLGRPFEDYLDEMWEPPEDMIQNCPLVRLEDGTATFMPCWQMGH